MDWQLLLAFAIGYVAGGGVGMALMALWGRSE